MLLRKTLRRAAATSPFSQDWLQARRTFLYAGLNFWRESMIISFQARPALFLDSGRYVVNRKQGFLLVEIMPLGPEVDASGLKKKQIDRKSQMLVTASKFPRLLNLADETTIERTNDGTTTRMTLRRVDQGAVVRIEGSSEQIEAQFSASEFFLVQRYFQFSFPFVYGWHGIGRPEYALANLDVEKTETSS